MPEEQLSVKQEMAIELIMAGHLDSEVAEQVGVARQTVSRWRNDHPAFIEALQSRRALLREQYMQKLGDLVEQAVAVLADALNSEDKAMRLRAAIVILKVSGLQAFARPPRERSSEELEQVGLSRALALALQQAHAARYQRKKNSQSRN